VKPLRVALDARIVDGTSGGVQQFVIGLASGLSELEDGDEQYLFLVYPGEAEWLRPYLGANCRMVEVRTRASGAAWKRVLRPALHWLRDRVVTAGSGGAGRLIRLPSSDGTLERAGADVVHFTTQDGFLTNVPSVYHPHDLLHLHYPELFAPGVRLSREVRYRAFCDRAAAVVMMSRWGRADLLQHYELDPCRVHVIPGASVLRLYGPEPGPGELARARAELRLEDGFAFLPATTWPHKNHLGLLEAIALLRDRDGVRVPLVCSGGQTEFYPEILARVDALGLGDQVRFVGFVEPRVLRALYRLSSCVVLPTRFEGWGMPVLEAFAAGTPIACSRVTGIPEQTGDAALLFDPDDVEQIAAALRELWTDPERRATLVERGRARERLYSWKTAAEQFRALYRQVAVRASEPGK
jgi:glycosyltransferase involved in cell wall biosynthesis